MIESTVDVWVGNFPSESDLSAYFEEDYSDDDTPISKFAADQGQWFYDHDFVERGFFETTADLVNALGAHSYAASYIDAVNAAYKALSLPPVNTAVFAFDAEISHPQSVQHERHLLVHLGRFHFTR